MSNMKLLPALLLLCTISIFCMDHEMLDVEAGGDHDSATASLLTGKETHSKIKIIKQTLQAIDAATPHYLWVQNFVVFALSSVNNYTSREDLNTTKLGLLFIPFVAMESIALPLDVHTSSSDTFKKIRSISKKAISLTSLGFTFYAADQLSRISGEDGYEAYGTYSKVLLGSSIALSSVFVEERIRSFTSWWRNRK